MRASGALCAPLQDLISGTHVRIVRIADLLCFSICGGMNALIRSTIKVDEIRLVPVIAIIGDHPGILKSAGATPDLMPLFCLGDTQKFFSTIAGHSRSAGQKHESSSGIVSISGNGGPGGESSDVQTQSALCPHPESENIEW
eukprot:CAMPEP_0113660440 /NCGR_PEP_ID=MMETSP0017_2-20120614/32900_1 /TAXON_ID=2856 /ORGANISM="Cylindrotheca closterium" /LENGTH=141 /DNA_ID=CAMNT_0000575073 /DNA_START=204 /DNA_END=627 /DNA_ORIENTATION=+ /assembly_acc=CAM_ASM_000147